MTEFYNICTGLHKNNIPNKIDLIYVTYDTDIIFYTGIFQSITSRMLTLILLAI
jgi:hypothetical protein